ncbi:hypothetical protein GUJ93_ZPchr0013g36896 [Zizania palustris]|uniref:Symplekin C-terminal domain-containing protein n=1 Tax=Zizania palustris TaxID=103762 RepID=A0A8J5X0U9_ZIZPA|nr:hypothetical protein GUJ93_ZPchr0013g36896 [Zizania palustris]
MPSPRAGHLAPSLRPKAAWGSGAQCLGGLGIHFFNHCGSPQNGHSLDPSEILIAIHVIDPEKEGIPLKKVIDACAACFEQRTIFTQQVLAKTLNQLVEQIPLPLLFMRTVMQAIGAFPALVDFVMDVMSRLVSKQIWKYPKLWVGFLKCAILTKPQSYGVLLQLPAPQLENALSKNPVLKAPLVEHANQPNVRSTLPRSTLVVLGLVEDQQQPAPQSPRNLPLLANLPCSALYVSEDWRCVIYAERRHRATKL